MLTGQSRQLQRVKGEERKATEALSPLIGIQPAGLLKAHRDPALLAG
jgi:hypothetical protein